MGYIILVSGPNSSGKSLFAEGQIAQTPGPRYYIATMIPRSQDNHQRIAKHRRQRARLNFTTIESPYEVGNLPVEPDAAVLLEDVSNLFSNGMFEQNKDAGAVFADIQALAGKCGLLVAVTISGLSAEGYQGETADYIHGLNRLNELLWERADAVIEMENGLPEYRKGAAGFEFD